MGGGHLPITPRTEALALLVGEMLYTYYFVLRWKRPSSRFLALLPILPPTLLVPWRGPSGVERILYSFVFVWIIGTKLLLAAWGRGAAADPVALSSFPRFFSAMVFTLHLKFDDHRALHPPSAAPPSRDPADFRNGYPIPAASSSDPTAFRNGHSITAASSGDLADSGNGGLIPAAPNSESTASSKGDFATGASSIDRSDSKASSWGDSAANGLIRRKSLAIGDQRGEERISDRQASVEADRKADVGRGEGKSLASIGAGFVSALVNSQTGYIVVLRSLFHFVVSASFVRVLLAWKPQIPESVLALLYALLIYFACLFIFGGAAGIPAMIFGIQLHPQFNMPYLATSLGDFWGRRWNLLVNNLLRASVYEPILQSEKRQREKKGQKSSKPSNEARAVGTFASFLVSGLMHELIFFYLLKARPTWEMTGFFVVNGLGTILEAFVMRSRFWGRGFSLPTVVRWAYTMGFVYATGRWLFFPPLDRPGMIDSSLVDLGRFIDWVEQTVGLS